MNFGPPPLEGSGLSYWTVQAPDGGLYNCVFLNGSIYSAVPTDTLPLDTDVRWAPHRMTLRDFRGCFPPVGTRVRSERFREAAEASLECLGAGLGTVTEHYHAPTEDRYDSYLITWDDPSTAPSSMFCTWGASSPIEVLYVPGGG